MADWHVNLGVVLSASGDEAQALTQFEAAGALNPYLRATARFSSGNALMAQGKTAEAEQQYREALEANSLMPKAENALGVILANQGKAAEAEQAFRRAVKIDSTLVSARVNLASLIEKQGNLSVALKEYEQAEEADPANLETYCQMVRVYRKMNDREKAIEQFRLAVQTMPDNPEAQYLLGNLLEQYGQLTEASRPIRRPCSSIRRSAGRPQLCRSSWKRPDERLRRSSNIAASCGTILIQH